MNGNIQGGRQVSNTSICVVWSRATFLLKYLEINIPLIKYFDDAKWELLLTPDLTKKGKIGWALEKYYL